MAMSASEAPKRLFPLIEQVNDGQEPVEIVSKAGTAYLMSADQWRSLMETAPLLRSPLNAARLLRSIADEPPETLLKSQPPSAQRALAGTLARGGWGWTRSRAETPQPATLGPRDG